MIQGRLLSKSFDNANISFILVPLVDRDHETIKNIMCVETTQRYSAIGKLYSEARIAVGAQNGFNQGDMNRLADRLVQISREVAHSYGLSESDLAKCQSSKDLELAIIATWEHGWAKNRERDWPFVMVNGKSTLIKTSAALTAAAEGR